MGFRSAKTTAPKVVALCVIPPILYLLLVSEQNGFLKTGGEGSGNRATSGSRDDPDPLALALASPDPKVSASVFRSLLEVPPTLGRFLECDRDADKVLVFVHSFPDEADLRNRIRNTWGSARLSALTGARVLFVVGHAGSGNQALPLVKNEVVYICPEAAGEEERLKARKKCHENPPNIFNVLGIQRLENRNF